MSAAPQFPPNYSDRQPGPPPLPPRRRPLWKTIAIWFGALVALLILVVAIGVVVLLYSPTAHRWLLSKAQQKATAALGSNVAVRDYGLRFSGFSPTIDLYDVVINGADPYPTPALLTVPRLHVVIKVTSLLRKTWYLDDIRVERPVVRVIVDKTGADNIPATKSTPNEKKSNTNLFDLGIRHALLEGGEIYYNNRKSELDADLHELRFQAGFHPEDTSYTGSLKYQNGHIKVQNYAPLTHDLDAQFKYTPNAFELTSATVRSGRSQFDLYASVQDLAEPKVHATYKATVDSGQFRQILKNPSLPVGMLNASGTLDYATQPNVPLLQGVKLHGVLDSPALSVSSPSFRGTLRNLHADYTVENNNAAVSNLRASTMGGEVTGSASIRDLTGSSRSQADLNVKGVSLAQLQTATNNPSLRNLGLTGTLNGAVHANWGKTTNDLQARADVNVNGAMAGQNGAQRVPLSGAIHANYNGATKAVTLNNSSIRAGNTTLNMNGTLGAHSALTLDLNAVDLHQIENTLAALRGTPGPPLGLYGTAQFHGTVSGSTSAPHLVGLLVAHNLQIRGTTWSLLRTNVDAAPTRASLQNGELDAARGGRITFNLTTGLRKWSFTETSPFDVGLNANNVNVTELAKVAGSTAPVTGTLSANLAAHGTELNPIGQGKLSLTNAKVSGENINSLNVSFNGTGNEVHATADARLPAGPARAVLTYFPRQKGYEAQLQATGLRIDQLNAIKQKNMGIAGVINLVATGRGTIDNPQLTASLTVPQLTMKNQTISGITLNAAVANHVANFNLDSHLMNTGVSGKGTIALVGDYYANVTLDTQPIQLQPLVALYAPSQAGNLTGQTEIHAAVKGPLKRKELLDAHIVIPTLAVNYKNTVQIGAPQPIRVDYSNGILRVQRAALRGTGTNIEFQGTVPLTSTAPASVMAVGTIDLRLAQLVNPDITSSGQVKLNINGFGRRSDPTVQGDVQIVNANFATGSVPLGLQNGNGTMTLTRDRLVINSFKGVVGGGELTMGGGVTYRPAVHFDVAVAGKDIRMLYESSVRLGVDTKLTLAGNMQQAMLNGNVHINQLQFTPDFDLMDFMGSFGGGAATPPPTGGFSQGLQLNVGVASTSGFNLVSRTMSLQAGANLRLTGTAAQPVVLGRVNLNGGDLIFSGNRYLIEGGTVDFVNPSRTDPVVNVSVNSRIQQYDIRMHFWGPADHLHTNYASDPALPPADIINLIAFGKTSEASAANPSPPGNFGAEAALASQVSGQVTSRLSKIAGISQLSLDPLRGCGQESGGGGACITVQQRVTSKIYVTFSADPTSTSHDTIQLEYQHSKRLSFSGSRDQNGGFAIDTRIHKTW